MRKTIDLDQLKTLIDAQLPRLTTSMVEEWESLDINIGVNLPCFSIGNDGEIYIDGSGFVGEPVPPALIEAMAAVLPLIRTLSK